MRTMCLPQPGCSAAVQLPPAGLGALRCLGSLKSCGCITLSDRWDHTLTPSKVFQPEVLSFSDWKVLASSERKAEESWE